MPQWPACLVPRACPRPLVSLPFWAARCGPAREFGGSGCAIRM